MTGKTGKKKHDRFLFLHSVTRGVNYILVLAIYRLLSLFPIVCK